jgi:hypothetical protein
MRHAVLFVALAGCGSVMAPRPDPGDGASDAPGGERGSDAGRSDARDEDARSSPDRLDDDGPPDAPAIDRDGAPAVDAPPPRCAADEHACDGAVLKVCNADRTGFVPLKTCATAALCNPSAGDCTTSACVPSQYRCMGDVLQRCNADQTAFDMVQSCPASLCDASQKTCLACVKKGRKCASPTQLRTCAADGLSASTQDCAGMTPYCQNDGCTACKTGACGDGRCPADCASESVMACPADCGALPFAEHNAQRLAGKDWAVGDLKGECGAFQALSGLSAAVGGGRAHALLCSRDLAAFPHDAQVTSCRALDFSVNNTALSTDWDVGFLKGECANDEFVAGVSQTVAGGALKAILCCRGQVAHKSCTTQVFYGQDAAEPGATDDTGDWDPNFAKGQCGPGRYVAGVSRFVVATGAAMAGAAHAVFCCGP